VLQVVPKFNEDNNIVKCLVAFEAVKSVHSKLFD
jgi:hypothetical protein